MFNLIKSGVNAMAKTVNNMISNKNEVKEYYTYEESLKFTRKDMDENPELFKALERSMQQWGKKE